MEVNPGFLILTLYIIISSNFLAPLISCKLQTILSDSILLRHLMGLLTFIFFVGFTNVKNTGFLKVLSYSVGIYAWFLATTRMDIRLWVPLLAVFAVLFLLETYKNTLNETDAEKEKADLAWLNTFLVGVSFFLTVAGVLVYLGAKKVEYGKSFDFEKFVLGKITCRQRSPDLSIVASLKGLQKFLKN